MLGYYLYSYNYLRLFLIIAVTICSFFWIRRVEVLRIKIWYLLLASFIMLYSGIGGAIVSVEKEYVIFYCVYVFVLGAVLHLFYHWYIRPDYLSRVSSNTKKYNVSYSKSTSRAIIIIYFLSLLFPLVYPSFRLGTLLHPPTPSLEGLHYSTFVEGDNRDAISSIVDLFSKVLSLFFYLSLYKYRKSPIKLLFFLLVPVYLDLCNRGIFGRGEAMIPLLIVALSLFEDASPRIRRVIVLSLLIAAPFISYLFVQFSFLRVGESFQLMSFGEAVQILFGQEIAFPLHFSEYFGKPSMVSISSYFLWLLLLPLPGFLKFGLGDPQINMRFTVMVTGLTPSDAAFSICLPGLVGESYFVFGQYLFPIHAIILATLVSIMIKYLSRSDTYRYVFYMATFLFSYNVCRGGTASAYSFFFKQFLILIIVMYFFHKPNRK